MNGIIVNDREYQRLLDRSIQLGWVQLIRSNSAKHPFRRTRRRRANAR